ncbi:MAG: isopentenyl-diphosphate Delta-isomerase [Gemmatimonadetes bacterium]|nr:isopentenyl-diphosphate Delta-isomerase [Gemmatimonadota bacterium]
MEERVVLVDENDLEVGTAGKLAAHREPPRLHRAFSVFVFNTAGELLLQRRAAAKYHSAGLWSNTCCGHPRPGEDTLAAAHRRLEQEMGFDCELRAAFRFTYRAELGQGVAEHEFDHVFLGRFDGKPAPDPLEADGWRWAAPEVLRQDVARRPEAYTVWFRIALERLCAQGAVA